MARRVIVGVSGGVDSAVAALLLCRQGFEVHGLHMTNWDEADDYCTAAEDYQAARRVCNHLGIPLHRVNFSLEYREQVFGHFLREYREGRTPNPDVLCNRYIKFGSFMAHARRLGAQHVGTGHYARVVNRDGVRLLKATDAEKDQTYFLHAVPASALSLVTFPLGDLTKRQVRRIANDAGLPNHDRPDSTGICFIGERPFREFLARYIRGTSGEIQTPEGTQVGRHSGLMFYTLGQRSGLGIGGVSGSAGGAWYVAAKDPVRNALVVVQGREHRLLWSREVETATPLWIHGAPAALSSGEGWSCEARVRHRQAPSPCVLRPGPGNTIQVSFERPQWAVTPGQFAVFYDGEECLGGAVIERASPVRAPVENLLEAIA